MSDDTPYKLDITVAGHTVIAEGPDREWVEKTARSVFEETKEYARRMPVGFAATGAQVEIGVSYE